MDTDGHVVFERFFPHLQPHLVPKVVDCYREVFADPPWNEKYKCSACGKHWGNGHTEQIPENLTHCGVALEDFWPRDVVEADLRREVTEHASCWLARADSKLIGFCWGYPIEVSDLDKKLELTVSDEIHRRFGVSEVALQDEVGVVRSWRGKKVAKALFSKRLDDFLARGLEIGVVRTRKSPEPSVTYLWFTQRLGYEQIAEYPGSDGRVILARPLGGLVVTA